jgi:hypothetical protein
MSSTIEITDEMPYLATFTGASTEYPTPSTGMWNVCPKIFIKNLFVFVYQRKLNEK